MVRWTQILGRLASRPVLDGFPALGHMIETRGKAIGVLLTITTRISEGNTECVRCNLSSWYVKPAYRLYAATLTLRAANNRLATYLNVSPAENTWPIIEAQGFRRFSNGVFAAVPLLSRHGLRGRVLAMNSADDASSKLDSEQRHLLLDHAEMGCMSLYCDTPYGVFPFVFRRRTFDRHRLPCAQLVYAADVGDVARCANMLGRYLAKQGIGWMLIGANAPIQSLPGRYFPNKMPMYYRGTPPRHPGDIAYTEAAVFGL